MNIELIDAHHFERDHVLAETFPFLANLDLYYPSISTWFAQSFSQGLAQGKNVLLAARGSEGRLEGVALGKKTATEVKMQCVRVAEEMLHQYSRIFVKRYGFSLDDVAKGAYRPRKLEYYFNGARG